MAAAPRDLLAAFGQNGRMRHALLLCFVLTLPCLAAHAAEPQPTKAPATDSEEIPYWMIGRFMGRNDTYGGRYVELVIYTNGRVAGIVDGRMVLEGVAKGERIYVEDAELIVTRTDVGLITTEVGNETNVVVYERL